ncbi:integrase, partial [Pseudomonas aeruginosa]
QWDIAVEIARPTKSRQALCNNMHSALKTLHSLGVLTADPTFWKHPYVGAHGYEAENGSSADTIIKAKKLPNQDSLLIIADVFSRGASETLEDIDTMITSTTAILISAPIRISETLRFRSTCFNGELDKNGQLQHYISYWVPKLGEFDRKPIPLSISEVTEDAFQRLLEITEEGRRLARYMETSPIKFYRHPACPNVPDDQILTAEQVSQALGFSKVGGCGSFLKNASGSASLKGHTLNSLWKLVLKMHLEYNPNFPYQEKNDDLGYPPLKMSESLFCFRSNQLSLLGDASPVLLRPFSKDNYTKRFQISSGSEASNFFVRHGYEPASLKSHSLRHFLNRLGRSNCVSIEMLTEWSSRATTKQTRTYLNDDPVDSGQKSAHLLGTLQPHAPLEPITDEQIIIYDQGPYHRSRYGICRRSWRAGPCNKFADCLNCSELLMCKGDKIAIETIVSDRENLSRTYAAALTAIANGERSASRWTEIAGPQIARLDQLIAIMKNPSIPNGSPIEMAGSDFNHEGVLVSEKAEAAGVKFISRSDLGINYGEGLLACLDLLWKS